MNKNKLLMQLRKIREELIFILNQQDSEVPIQEKNDAYENMYKNIQKQLQYVDNLMDEVENGKS